MIGNDDGVAIDYTCSIRRYRFAGLDVFRKDVAYQRVVHRHLDGLWQR